MDREDNQIQERPFELSSYIIWLQEYLGIGFDDRFPEYYVSVCTKIRDNISKSNIWNEIIRNLKELDAQYRRSHNNFPLLAHPNQPLELLIKPYNSMLKKTFRMNVINNNNWPNPPREEGWINPYECFECIDDIIRTSVVVKYLDGVKHLADDISKLASNLSIGSTVELKAKEEGYYAAHIYVSHVEEIPNIAWDTRKTEMLFEIQIRTQVQDLIRRLLHTYYSEHRLSKSEQKDIWQWDYKSDEFATSYIGHIIHYIEGKIVEIRDSQSEIKP